MSKSEEASLPIILAPSINREYKINVCDQKMERQSGFALMVFIIPVNFSRLIFSSG